MNNYLNQTMKKAIIIFSTILFTSFLWNLPVVNFDLKNNQSHNCSSTNCPFHSNNFQNNISDKQIAFGSELGKVIKENHLTELGYKIKTIVIDPGHGGYDSGCLGGKSQEKHIALGIAKKLRAKIQATYPSVRIIMTRDKDYFVPLHKRANIANRNKADLFISIHANAMSNADYIRGSETYVLGLHKVQENFNVAKRENASVLLEENYEENYDFDPNSAEGHIMLSMYQNAYLENSILLAEKVENRMATSAKRKSRGVKQAGFIVLHQTAMPAVLVETGFLTNKTDENFLLTKDGQNKVATAILRAFGDYKKEVETGYSQPVVSNIPKDTPQKTSTKKPAPERASIPKGVKTNASEPFPVTSEAPKGRVQFRVQLAASPKPIDISRGKWQKAENYLIEVIRENSLYKYQARGFDTISKAEAAKIILRRKGFNGAFIVAYRNGEKISLDDL